MLLGFDYIAGFKEIKNWLVTHDELLLLQQKNELTSFML